MIPVHSFLYQKHVNCNSNDLASGTLTVNLYNTFTCDRTHFCFILQLSGNIYFVHISFEQCTGRWERFQFSGGNKFSLTSLINSFQGGKNLFFIPNPFTNQKRLEEEKKLKKKMKKKEREERLKKEGKFLTEKQKQDKRRLEQMLAAMKEAGKLSSPPHRLLF